MAVRISVFAVFAMLLLTRQASIGQESDYVDLAADGASKPGLQSNPLTMSAFPTTLSVALSTQHACLRTVDIDGKVWQWQLYPPPKPELITSSDVEPACAVLSSDAKWLAVAGTDSSIMLMDLDSKQVKFHDKSQTANTVALRFSADTERLAAVTSQGKVRIWNIPSGDETHEFPTDPGSVQTIDFAPDGNTLGVASFSPELKLFDLNKENSSSKPNVITIDDSRITSIGFTPSGEQIVVAAADGTLFVQNLTDRSKRISLESYPFAIWSLAFDHDGTRMVGNSWDGTSRIWDTRSWQVIQKLKGHEESVSATIIGAQGMVSAGLDGQLNYWMRQKPGIEPKGMITGNTEPAWVATYSPDGKQLFVGGRGNRFEIWDLEKKREMVFATEGPLTTRCAAFSPDGKMLATGGDDRSIQLVSTVDGKLLHTLAGHRGLVSAVLFADDGKTLISGCDRGFLKFWNTETGQETETQKRHKQQLYCASLSPDEKWLITGGGHWAKQNPGELIVWDLAQRQFKSTLLGHKSTVWSIVFTPDGKHVATSDAAGEVKIWNIHTLQEVRTLTHDVWVRPMAMSPDGKTLAVGRGDGSIRRWDTRLWTEQEPYNGHEDFTFWLQYSPDGKSLASAGNDGTVRFWPTR